MAADVGGAELLAQQRHAHQQRPVQERASVELAMEALEEQHERHAAADDHDRGQPVH